MNAFLSIIEVVELTALIVLLIYLIRLINERNENAGKATLSGTLDRNLAELAEFHRLMINNADTARIWQEGCADLRLNDLDRARFAMLAQQFLALLANQKQRAEAIEAFSLAQSATDRLITELRANPGLLAAWQSVAGLIASEELRDAVAMATAEPEPEVVPEAASDETVEPEAAVATAPAEEPVAVAQEEAAAGDEVVPETAASQEAPSEEGEQPSEKPGGVAANPA